MRWALYRGQYVPFHKEASDPIAIIDSAAGDHRLQVELIAQEQSIPLSELYAIELPEEREQKEIMDIEQSKRAAMSDCHSSARCDEEQRVMIASSVITTTVHNVRQMQDATYGDKVLVRGDGSYRGFIKNGQGHRILVKRLQGETIWVEKE